MTTGRSLRALLLEGGLIVGSILLAFAIDAAWDESRERRDEARLIEQLVIELGLYAQLLDDADARTQQAVDAAEFLLEAVHGDAALDLVELQSALNDLRSTFRLAAATAAFDLFAGAETMGLLSSPVLRQGMSDIAAFVSLVREFEAGEVGFIDRQLTPFLTEHADMLTALPATSLERVGPSRFSTEWEGLRANREFSNLLVERIRQAEVVTRFRDEIRAAVREAQVGTAGTRPEN